MNTKTPIVSYDNVRIKIENRQLFDGISLTLYEGEVFILFGPANCGKSLFGRLALGLIKPDTGQIYIEGTGLSHYDALEMPQLRKKMGAVFINSALISNLTASENVALPLRYHTNLDEDQIQQRVDQILEFFRAKEFKDSRPVMMDVVAQRKVAVARALVLRPRIVFLDEPTVHLGFIAANLLKQSIFDFVRSRFWPDEAILHETGHKESGTTIFISTNDPGPYLRAGEGDRFGMLYDGKLVFVGTPYELQDTRSEHVHQFVSGRAQGPVQEY